VGRTKGSTYGDPSIAVDCLVWSDSGPPQSLSQVPWHGDSLPHGPLWGCPTHFCGRFPWACSEGSEGMLRKHSERD